MTNELAAEIEKLIIGAFPVEPTGTYFIPAVKKKDSLINKSEAACGMLMNMWRNKQNKQKQHNQNKKSKTDSAENQEANDSSTYSIFIKYKKIF